MKKMDIDKCEVCGSASFRPAGKGYDYEYLTSKDEFQFAQCNACNHLFLKNPPAASELRTIYPDNYLPYRFDDELNRITKFARGVVQRLKINSYKKYCHENASILDIGAGTGILVIMLRDFGSKGWKLTANDLDISTLRHLEGHGISLLPGNFGEMEIKEKFDVIIMNQLIEHLYEPSEKIKKCADILNDGGTLIIETPNCESLDFRLFKKAYWGGYHIPRHFNIFSDRTIRRCMENNGFRVHRIEYMLSPAFWVFSLHHFLYDRNNSLHKLCSINNFFLTSLFSLLDLILSKLYKTSNMRIIAVKWPEGAKKRSYGKYGNN